MLKRVIFTFALFIFASISAQAITTLKIYVANKNVKSNNNCTYQTITFHDSLVYNGTFTSKIKYKWYFNGVSTATDTGVTVTKQFTSTGTVVVSLTATDKSDVPNLFDSTTKTISVNLAGVKPGFTFTGAKCQRVELNFFNSSVEPGSPITVNYFWDFGDHSTIINSANPGIHVYPNVGSYIVTLKDSESNGCVNTISQTIVIAPTPFPRQPTIVSDCQGKPISFTLKPQLADTSGFRTTYSWSFQDNTVLTSTYKNLTVNKTFANDNNYVVVVRYIDHVGGCTDSISSNFTVYSKPRVRFGYVPVCQDSIANFFDSTSVPFGPGATDWYFEFFDSLHNSVGTPVDSNQAVTPDHFVFGFPHGGTFFVRETVTTGTIGSSGGCYDSATQKIYVNPLPKTDFTFKNTCQDSSIQFTDVSTIPGATAANNLKIVGWIWYFGDSISKNKPYTSNLQNPSHKYANPGYKYKVKLVTITSTGCRDSVTKLLKAYPSPISDFEFTSQCAGQPIAFANNANLPLNAQNDSLTRSYWIFGDGNKDSTTNPVHTFNTSGVFNVKMSAFTGYGCADTISKPVLVYALPVPSFKTVGNCERDSVQFISTSTTTYDSLSEASYSWDFGDSTVVNGKSKPKHLFRYAGTFPVKLTVTSMLSTATGCTKDTVINVTIIPGPHSTFTWNASCFGQPVLFNNTTNSNTPGPIKFNWDFGDGTTDTIRNPTHIYNFVKNVHVKLVSLMPATGCIDSNTQFVSVAPLPVAFFKARSTCNDSLVKFKDSSTLAKNFFFKSFVFDFGDGQKASGSLVQHKYAVPGTYTVKEVVTTTTNCQDSFFRTIITYPKPAAAFTSNTACAGTPMQFTDGTPASDSVATWNWLFSNVDTSSAQNPKYTYSNSSFFVANLKVTTIHGCSDQISKNVNVLIQPGVTYSPPVGCDRRVLNFYGRELNPGADTIQSWLWNFGDSTATNNNQNTTHTYADSGSYLVKLQAISTGGCYGTFIQKVVVLPLPFADFTYTGNCLGDRFHFSDTLGDNTSYPGWNFGDGSADTTGQFPGHTYTAPGIYQVKIYGYDVNGIGSPTCTPDTIIHSVVVYPLPIAKFAWDTACFENPTQFYDSSDAGGGRIVQYNWNFVSKVDTVDQNPFYTFPDTFPGLQTFVPVTLKVVTDKGCGSSVTEDVFIKQRPRTLFEANPFPITIQNPAVTFTNKTQFADTNQYYWNFGDGHDSHLSNPIHIYNDTGTYVVTLSSMSLRGCVDTFRYTLYVTPGYSLFAPNAITVNGDLINDEWKPKGVGVIDYDVVIVDRWGQQVFHSNDINQAWKGDYNGNGVKVPEGVYVYVIKAGNFANTDFTSLKGQITVLR